MAIPRAYLRLSETASDSVERMSPIERVPIGAYSRAIALVHEAAQAVVARFAERAQRAEAELVVVALMRRMVISDRRRGDAALLLAQGAQRRDLKLMLRARSPGL